MLRYTEIAVRVGCQVTGKKLQFISSLPQCHAELFVHTFHLSHVHTYIKVVHLNNARSKLT